MDTILKMLLIAFVSLLAFSSGVYFGKQMSDSDYQLKALESDFNSHGTVAQKTENPEDTISEDEVASLSEKYLNEEKKAERGVASEEHGAKAEGHEAPAAHGEKAAHAAPAKHEEAAVGHGEEAAPKKADAHAAAAPAKSGKPDLSAVHKAAERVAHNAAPIEKAHAPAAESRVPNSLPKTVGAKSVVEFTVQVASYPTAQAAKEHATRLVNKGLPAFPVEATINGRTWYRVSVGSFKTMKEATGFRAQVLKQADVTSAIVQKIQR